MLQLRLHVAMQHDVDWDWIAGARLVVGGEARGAGVALDDGVAKKGSLDQMGLSCVPLSNILCKKQSSLWSAKLSKEEDRKLGVMDFGRAPHGGREERCMCIGCAAAASWIGNRCRASIIAAVQRAMLQLRLHVAVQHDVDWDWSSARGVAWCPSHGASADACAHCVRALRVSRQAVWCWVWQVKGTPF